MKLHNKTPAIVTVLLFSVEYTFRVIGFVMPLEALGIQRQAELRNIYAMKNKEIPSPLTESNCILAFEEPPGKIIITNYRVLMALVPHPIHHRQRRRQKPKHSTDYFRNNPPSSGIAPHCLAEQITEIQSYSSAPRRTQRPLTSRR